MSAVDWIYERNLGSKALADEMLAEDIKRGVVPKESWAMKDWESRNGKVSEAPSDASCIQSEEGTG